MRKLAAIPLMFLVFALGNSARADEIEISRGQLKDQLISGFYDHAATTGLELDGRRVHFASNGKTLVGVVPLVKLRRLTFQELMETEDLAIVYYSSDQREGRLDPGFYTVRLSTDSVGQWMTSALIDENDEIGMVGQVMIEYGMVSSHGEVNISLEDDRSDGAVRTKTCTSGGFHIILCIPGLGCLGVWICP